MDGDQRAGSGFAGVMPPKEASSAMRWTNLPTEFHARVAEAVCLTYRTPAASVVGLLPAGIELACRGPWALWQVVCRRVEHLRPAGVPGPMGLGFNHVAYRLRVQAMTASAQVVAGVYDVHSVIDAPLPALVDALGHRLRDTPPVLGHVEVDGGDCGVRVCVKPGAIGGAHALRLDVAHAPAARMEGSCFATLADVREGCAPVDTCLTLGVESNPEAGRRLRVTRAASVGRAAGETPLVVREQSLGYFEAIGQSDQVALEWAARLRPVETRWELRAPQALIGGGGNEASNPAETDQAKPACAV